MKWKEISKRIDDEITENIKVPKTDGRTRPVTKIEGTRIYMRTGVTTSNEKYTTKEMLQYAYDMMTSGKQFTSADFKSKFPREYNQGSCVFSMTGGVLVLLGIAECIPNPLGSGFAYVSINEK